MHAPYFLFHFYSSTSISGLLQKYYRFTRCKQFNLIIESDITRLQPIKRKGSYNNLDEYLDTYHNLLREECYRNLHADIRNFIENPKNHDPKQMNMYR